MADGIQDSGVSGGDWAGDLGRRWIEAEAVMDRMLQPMLRELLAAAAPKEGERVLDIGCGAGGTTVALADAVGPTGSALGVDVSPHMVAAAARRAKRDGVAATFVEANAETHAFAPHAYDLVASRFGIMFFDDPQAAFRNFAKATDPRGRLVALVWRWAEENEFMTTAERAAATLLELTPRVRDAAGQFGFADPDRTAALLRDSGWRDVSFRPVDARCEGRKEDLEFFFTRLGPVGRLFPGLSESMQQQVVDAVAPAFEPYVDGDAFRFDAACWLINARPA